MCELVSSVLGLGERWLIEKRGVRYLRFRNSFVPSISVMYSKPDSTRALPSSMLVAVLQVHSSESFR